MTPGKTVLHALSPVTPTRICRITLERGDKGYSTTHQNFGAWLREFPDGHISYVLCPGCAAAMLYLEIAETRL